MMSELPPLPEPFTSLPITGSQTTSVHVWASDAMHAYAAAAVAAETERLTMLCDNLRRCLNDCASSAYREGQFDERERCAKICDDLDAMSRDPMVCRGSAQECAEAIRAQQME